jgi:hypothetical protein
MVVPWTTITQIATLPAPTAPSFHWTGVATDPTGVDPPLVVTKGVGPVHATGSYVPATTNPG